MNKKFFMAMLVAAFVGTTSVMAETVKSIQYRVENMRCGKCAGRIKKALDAKEGVGNITFDMEKKVVTVSYDANKVSPNVLADAIKALKFTPTAYSKSEVIKRTASYKASQMRCGGCAKRVKANIGKVAGVQEVDVDLATKSVKITYDANKTSKSAFKDEFKKFDYTVTNYFPNKIVAYAQVTVEKGDLNSDAAKKLGKVKGFLDVNVNQKTQTIAISYNTKVLDEAGVKKQLKDMKYVLAD